LRALHQGSEVHVSYEASGCGFGLADRLIAEGFAVSVLAPSHLPQSQKHRSEKTDANDVVRIMEVLRGSVLAGNRLPKVWIPPAQLRDDRELVRRRLELGEELSRTKNRIHGLLQRRGIRRPDHLKSLWTQKYLRWLDEVAGVSGRGLGEHLRSLLRELRFCLSELDQLDRELQSLSDQSRYQAQAFSLTSLKGVGLLTAMVFLTELGDLKRFGNRRALASYLGLTPRSYESGEHNDRKGHISRLGPSRVRKVLNQAALAVINFSPEWGRWYRLRTRDSKSTHKKKMIVAVMRRLGVWMWHQGLKAESGVQLSQAVI
jgi:transposase